MSEYSGLILVNRNTLGPYILPSFRNSEIKQLSPLFFATLEDIDLIFGMWVYNDDQVYISFRSNAFWPSYGPWTEIWPNI
jgi:hypothetical protein